MDPFAAGVNASRYQKKGNTQVDSRTPDTHRSSPDAPILIIIIIIVRQTHHPHHWVHTSPSLTVTQMVSHISTFTHTLTSRGNLESPIKTVFGSCVLINVVDGSVNTACWRWCCCWSYSTKPPPSACSAETNCRDCCCVYAIIYKTRGLHPSLWKL